MSTQDSKKIGSTSLKLANTFEWKLNCFICGGKCESKRNVRKDWHLPATMKIRQTIEMRCTECMRESTEDQWALEILG